MVKKIGVISDTHLNRADDLAAIEEIFSTHLGGTDLILHAGDMVDLDVFRNFLKGVEFFAVSGNMDVGPTQDQLPMKTTIEVEDARIGLIHGNDHLRPFPDKLLAEFDKVNAIVFGHTHRPLCETHGDVLVLNPGSPFQPRGGDLGSVALLTVDGRRIEGQIIFLGPERNPFSE